MSIFQRDNAIFPAPRYLLLTDYFSFLAKDAPRVEPNNHFGARSKSASDFKIALIVIVDKK